MKKLSQTIVRVLVGLLIFSLGLAWSSYVFWLLYHLVKALMQSIA